MPDLKPLIRDLAQHAIGKKGALQDSPWSEFDVLEYPHVELAGTSWGGFFDVEEAEGTFAHLPVLRDALQRHRAQYPVIRESRALERDGHIYIDVPLDAGLPVEFLKALIDDAYTIVWNKLDAAARLKIELAGLPYDEPKLIDRLIEIHGLQEQRRAIRKLARHALLLRTKRSSEAKITPGATKIGGQPDLPGSTEWPAYRGGKPLAFLAQINLAQVATLKSPIKGLPVDGLLSVFSAWGWTEPDSSDPQTPEGGADPGDEQPGWTVVLHTPRRARLERRRTPRGVNAFKAAAVEPTPILSLPKHAAEPPVAALGWSDDLFRRFDHMQMDYQSLQMRHWLGNSDVDASHHLLGGYALFQQMFPEEILDSGWAMFLQIGSDAHAEMCWGDGGELTFYADATALAKGRFDRLWGTCQCG